MYSLAVNLDRGTGSRGVSGRSGSIGCSWLHGSDWNCWLRLSDWGGRSGAWSRSLRCSILLIVLHLVLKADVSKCLGRMCAFELLKNFERMKRSAKKDKSMTALGNLGGEAITSNQTSKRID
jgi:hypothetical protein